TTIGARIARDFPDSNKGWGVIAERYADTLVGREVRTALLVLLTATGFVLLIGWEPREPRPGSRGVAGARGGPSRVPGADRRPQIHRSPVAETLARPVDRDGGRPGIRPAGRVGTHAAKLLPSAHGRHRTRCQQRPDDRAAADDTAVSGRGTIEPVSAGDPHRR